MTTTAASACIARTNSAMVSASWRQLNSDSAAPAAKGAHVVEFRLRQVTPTPAQEEEDAIVTTTARIIVTPQEKKLARMAPVEAPLPHAKPSVTRKLSLLRAEMVTVNVMCGLTSISNIGVLDDEERDTTRGLILLEPSAVTTEFAFTHLDVVQCVSSMFSPEAFLRACKQKDSINEVVTHFAKSLALHTSDLVDWAQTVPLSRSLDEAAVLRSMAHMRRVHRLLTDFVSKIQDESNAKATQAALDSLYPALVHHADELNKIYQSILDEKQLLPAITSPHWEPEEEPEKEPLGCDLNPESLKHIAAILKYHPKLPNNDEGIQDFVAAAAQSHETLCQHLRDVFPSDLPCIQGWNFEKVLSAGVMGWTIAMHSEDGQKSTALKLTLAHSHEHDRVRVRV